MNSVKFYLSLFSILFLFCGLKVNAQAPTVTSFSPANAAVGVSVTITGTNFTGATAVTLGGVNASSFTVNSSTSISAVVGLGAANGSVSVTTSGGTASNTGFTSITITSFTPVRAAIGGTVTITGTNFSGITASSVKFGTGSNGSGGTTANSITSFSSTQIVAVVKTGTTTGSGHVAVIMGSVTVTRSGFTQVGTASASTFSPTLAAAGSSVTITGTNFSTSGTSNVTGVTFGGAAATSFSVTNATTLTAVVPAGAVTGSIVVSSGGLSTTATGGTFTFIPTPTISSYTPTTAATGTPITITGTNFSGTNIGSSTVSIGGVAATGVSVNSSTSITATVGASASGSSVSVTNNGGTATLGGFTYIPAPTISSFTPTVGATGGSIVITGENFSGTGVTVSSVKFGGTNATSFTVNSSTQITATVAVGTSGSVSVITTGGTASLAGFTYAPEPTITSFTPSSAGNGTTVDIYGTNLSGGAITVSAVRFGGTNATSYNSIDASHIQAVVATGNTGNVTVVTNGGTASLAGFTFVVLPIITSVSPSTAATGDLITLTGTDLSGTTNVSFGGVSSTTVTNVNATSVTATVPSGVSGLVSVILTTPAGTTSGNTITINNQWTGASTSDWNDAGSWSAGVVPTTEDVTIPSGLTTYPILSTDASVASIILNGTISLNDKLLTVQTSLTGSGTFKSTAQSSLEMQGTGTLFFDASNNSLGNLTINNDVTLGNSLNLYGILYPNSGTLTTGGNLILKSSSGSQGVVAAVGGTISGTVTTERFIPQNATFRAFRDLCPVVANAGSVFTNWQEGGVNNNGYGVQITGISGPWDMVDPVKGFDISKAGNGSMQTYNGTWSYATNTKTMNLDPAQGYRLLIRGNRSFTLFPVSQPSGMNSDATLRTTGNLVTGTVTYTTSGTSSTGGFSSSYGLNSGSTAFSFIGNPYASTVSWSNLINDIDGTHTSGISGSYYYLDPTLLDGSNASTYVTYNGFSNTSSGGSVGDDILPGQAIFVRNEGGGSPQVVFKESYKTTGNFPSLVFGTTKPVNKVVLQLFKNNRQIDGATLVFKSSFSKAIGKEDSKKLMNTGESLTFSESGNQLCIDGLSLPNSSDTISLQLSKMVVNTNYKIKFNTLLFDGKGMDAYVYDSYLNKKTLVNQDSLVLDFSTTTDSASYFNRFSVVFGANPLPIESINLSTALQTSNSVLVKWSTVNKSSVVNYTLQRSIDGHNYTDINRIAATKASNYSYTDAKAFNGINYYRVKAEDKVGVSTYSSISTIVVGKKSESVIVYPNPVINKSFNIKINNFASGNFTINVLNALGQSVQTKRGTNNSGALDETVNFNSLASGLYFVKVSASNGQTYQKEISIK